MIPYDNFSSRIIDLEAFGPEDYQKDENSQLKAVI